MAIQNFCQRDFSFTISMFHIRLLSVHHRERSGYSDRSNCCQSFTIVLLSSTKSAWIQMNCPIRLTVSIRKPYLADEISCESSSQTLLYFEKVRYCDNPAGVSIFPFLSEPTAQKSIAKHRGAKSKQSAPKRGSSLSLASSVSRSSSQYERFSFQPVFQKRKKPEVESSW